ncbi:MAG: glycosyltransferase family 9 protein [Bryobacteraceae bacterium]
MRRLVIRPGAIGDVIVSLPALEYLKASYTEVWVPGALVPLMRFADRARSIASTQLDMLELGLAPARLRQELASFDDIVCWYGANREEFRDAVAGLPFRFFDALPTGRLQNASDYYSEQVGAPIGRDPDLAVERSPGAAIVLHPFSGAGRKNWPMSRFRELAASIPGAVWCTESETEFPIPDLWELARWLGKARLYVGNDSGVTHLAAAAGVPTVALFGPTDPAVWAPRRARVIRREPLSELSVDDVRKVVVDCLR